MSGVEGVPSGYGLYLVQTLLALGAVCLLAYVVLRYGVKRLYSAGRKGARMRVIEHLPLEPRRSVYLVQLGSRYLLLGTGEAGVRFLTDVDRDDVEGAEESEEVEARTTSKEDRSPAPE